MSILSRIAWPTLWSLGILSAGCQASPVRLSISTEGAAVVNATVYFQRADSTLLSAALTDAEGNAEQWMPDGGFVTAVIPSAPNQEDVDVFTFSGVLPGDQLSLVNGDPEGDSIHVTVSAPTFEGAQYYQVKTSCGNGALTPPPVGAATTIPTILRLTGCRGFVDIIVSATGTDIVRHDLFAGHLPVSDMSELVLTNAYTAPKELMLTYSDSASASIDYRQFTFTDGGYMVIGSGVVALSASVGTSVALRPDIPSSRTLILSEPDNKNQLFDMVPASASSYSVDVMSTILRQVTSPPAYDVAGHQLVWAESAAGAAPLLASAGMMVSRDAYRWSWNVLSRYEGPALTYPVLPSDGPDLNVRATDDVKPSYFKLLGLPVLPDHVRTTFATFSPTNVAYDPSRPVFRGLVDRLSTTH